VTAITTDEAGAKEMMDDLEQLPADQLLRWALDRFSPKLALACSFQAEESALIDMMYRLRGSDFRIFTLDTGRLNQETYDCIDEIRQRYRVRVESFFPDFEKVQDMVRRHGFNLFYQSVELRKLCCHMRKVEPLSRALKDLDAWMTGLRREQAPSRTAVRKVELDRDHGNILKINPLADWGGEQLWGYIRNNNVPYNRLHDRGYPSIGCVPCTRAVRAWEDVRAGRWWWENPETKECGLHRRSDREHRESL
jgi:phosphoadenosine phosphosulfate reductase